MGLAFDCIFNGVKEMWVELLKAYVTDVKDRYPSRRLTEDPQLLTTQELQKEFRESMMRGKVAQARGVGSSRPWRFCQQRKEIA